MYYVYLIWSEKAEQFYVGCTNNIPERLNQHNRGLNISTKSGLPWKLVYYEAFMTKALAFQREKKLKHHGRGIVELKKRIGFS
jgi:putative endonuclease